jgi:membrane protease YdiL (CAAX protease family)
MNNFITQKYPRFAAFQSILLLIFLVLIALVVSQLLPVIGLGVSLEELGTVLQNPERHPEFKTPLLLIQALSSITAFIITPVLFLKYFDNQLGTQNIFSQKKDKQTDILVYVILPFLIISLMPLSAAIQEWNANIAFPEAWASFEIWAKDAEAQAQRITQFFVTFESFGGFLFVLVVISLIPGIGEELLFRGLLQNKFKVIFSNIHVSIWVTAFLFSLIHMQFYGFVPRMLLGALFGYLYHWSGNLLVPVVAHILHNGLTLLLVYLYQLKIITIDIDNTDELNLIQILISLVIGSIFIFVLRKKASNHKLPNYSVVND